MWVCKEGYGRGFHSGASSEAHRVATAEAEITEQRQTSLRPEKLMRNAQGHHGAPTSPLASKSKRDNVSHGTSDGGSNHSSRM